jgi:hypothetical protein
MYLCYIDESGTSELPGVSSHFVLAGVSLPVWHWRDADREISRVLAARGLADAELHTGWLLGSYVEQSKIPDFDRMNHADRRSAVERMRAGYLLKLQQQKNIKTLRQTKKRYRHTAAYIHLTRQERLEAVRAAADCVGQWGFARLFADCIDKLHYDPIRHGRQVDEQAFEQVVSRFERYLEGDPEGTGRTNYGMLVHDNNESVAHKHTKLMRRFHNQGTIWNRLRNIIETPLFVNSELTRMVQVADLCAYSLRRFVENSESDLFDRIFPRAFRHGAQTVGVRHFAPLSCHCKICVAHR